MFRSKLTLRPAKAFAIPAEGYEFFPHIGFAIA
jgi:hypothetical protein